MDFKNTALFVAFGALGAILSQLRAIYDRVSSFVIVRVHIDPGFAQEAVMTHLWKNFKYSRFGNRTFTGRSYYVRPKMRTGIVAAESVGTNVTFWQEFKPLFLANAAPESGGLNLSFIRGTFDLEKLISDATEELDQSRHGSKKDFQRQRFSVRKVFGSAKSNNTISDSGKQSLHPDETRGEDPFAESHLRHLLYTKEELMPLTSSKPFDNLSYPSDILDFIEEVRRWRNSKDELLKRGVPWRFGASLSGPPGSGKTSMVRAIAQELDLPIHAYDLTTMSNRDLNEAWDNSLSQTPCIVLLEDIDRIFDENKKIITTQNKDPLTLDALLNCIGGAKNADGILLIATANDVSKLDPALGVPDETGKSTRPGRLDRAVFVGLLDEAGRIKIAQRILAGYEDLISQTVLDGKGETGAQFESRCSKLFLEKYWGRPQRDVPIKEEKLSSTYDYDGYDGELSKEYDS